MKDNKVGRLAFVAAAGIVGLLGSTVIGSLPTAGAATAAGVAATAGSPPAGAPGAGQPGGHPYDVVVPPTVTATPASGAAAQALTTWAGSFTYGGTTYPYTMVGTNPTVAATSTVAVSITPVKIVLWDGSYYYPTSAVSQTANSALFHNASFKTGSTEYGDAIQRAEFWTTLNQQSHSRLGVPIVKPMITLNVPAADGYNYYAADGQSYAAVNVNWIDAKLRARSGTVAANTLPIYLTYETYLYQGSGSPGIGGYHSAVTNTSGRHTYAYASWVTGDLYGASSANTAALSHEIAEWFNDPYVNNKVPRWTVANEPQYGCSSVLEVGDPLVGTVFHVGGLNFQDEAFFSWFARQKPSIGYGGLYSYLGTFKTYSKSC